MAIGGIAIHWSAESSSSSSDGKQTSDDESGSCNLPKTTDQLLTSSIPVDLMKPHMPQYRGVLPAADSELGSSGVVDPTREVSNHPLATFDQCTTFSMLARSCGDSCIPVQSSTMWDLLSSEHI